MISTLFSKQFIPFLLVCAAVSGVSLGTAAVQTYRLETEQAVHEKTRRNLDRAMEAIDGWEKSFETMAKSADAQREAARACLDRELEAELARLEREDILRSGEARPRTEAEKKQVVDDATRKRAADRLNRPF